MTRPHRRASSKSFRICNRCEQELPATPEIFLRDASRPLGLAYECRACHSARKKGRDRRTERWSNLSPEGKLRRRAVQQRYARTTKGRAVFLRKAYEQVDACDLSTDEIVAIIEQPCCYCGTIAHNRGLDRIDNRKPHVRGNVQPACAPCNFARGDRFTVEEMMRIGVVIRQIWQDRASTEAGNEDRP